MFIAVIITIYLNKVFLYVYLSQGMLIAMIKQTIYVEIHYIQMAAK